MQWSGQATEYEHAYQPYGQEPTDDRNGGALPCPTQAQLSGHLIARLAVEHHVQIARRPSVTRLGREHCGAEDPRGRGAHRIGAAQRQGRASEKLAHRRQIDLRLAHHALVAYVGSHAPVGIEQIDLDAGVDNHQHRQQGLAGGGVGLIGVAHGDLGPVFDDVPRQTVRKTLQRLLLVLEGQMTSEQAHHHAETKQQQGQRERQSCGESALAAHATGSSKR